MEHTNTSTASLFRQALVDPAAVSAADFDRLLSEYPYAQPLHFAFARRKFLEGDAHPLPEKAVLLAPSPHWLREYVQGPDAENADAESPPSPEGEAMASRQSDGLCAPFGGDGGISEEERLPENPEDPNELAEAVPATPGEDEPSAKRAESEMVAPEEDELETLMRENIGSGYSIDTLYEKDTESEAETAESAEAQSVPEEKAADSFAAKEEKISLYDDELMPYSFRWWLHKTRMEHAGTYRPFADSPMFPMAARFDPAKLDEIILDQQIREHIMHLQSLEDKLSEDVRKQAVRPSEPNKTTEVIERFIREEPQIQPPPADQLTVENKARKSSEERFDQVTETLAAIYAEQGLQAKSIAVYQKLILKFPEKKPYFASRIQELEEKPQVTSH